MTLENITHEIDTENNKVTLKADEWLKQNRPYIADFIDGIEIDLDGLMNIEF